VSGDEKHGTVCGRPVLQGGTVGNQGTGEIRPNQRPEIAMDNSFGRFGQIASVESCPEFAQSPKLRLTRDCDGEAGVGNENLGHG
jgi:hypothetical protein